MEVAGFKQRPQRAALSEQVVLADNLRQVGRAEPFCEGRQPLATAACKQRLGHNGSMQRQVAGPARRNSWPRCQLHLLDDGRSRRDLAYPLLPAA